MTAPQVFYKIQTGKNIAIEESTIGGDNKREIFGSSNYSDFYRSEVELANAWRQVQSYKLASWEEEYYKNAISVVPIICQTYCLNPMNMTFSVKYVKEKKTNIYDDLRQAKILLFESADYYRTDSIALINKLIQPNYEKRQETIKKAIVIWEKALEEADFDNKKARIDQKVGRHLYYNLAVAYTLLNNYDKAQQYLQGRQDDETDNPFLKNALAGLKSLSEFIDDQKIRKELNSWRTLLVQENNPYVYKDHATKEKEKQDSIFAEVAKKKAIKDSIDAIKKPKTPVKKAPASKSPAKKPTKKSSKFSVFLVLPKMSIIPPLT